MGIRSHGFSFGEAKSMNGAILTAEEYISSRLEQYQGWYDRKSVSMKSKYLRMKALSVVGGSLVPVLINVPFQKFWGIPVVQIVVTVISLGVVVSLSLETVFHYREQWKNYYREQWKNYRSTEQVLGHEKFLFRTRVGRYHGLSDDDAFRLLVERVEDAVAVENAATLNTMTTAADTSDSSRSGRTRVQDQ
jgi:hypothetical protein